jgi:hypothetical protein
MFDDNPEWGHSCNIDRLSPRELEALKARAIGRARTLRSRALALAVRRAWSMPSAWLARLAGKAEPVEPPYLRTSLKNGEAL